jgi:hypothetical protein
MPLWNIYHPVGAYDADTKKAMSETIVKLYPMLPPFYVGVLFHAKPADTFFISGKPTDDFVRIAVDHIARQFPNQEVAQNWLNQMSKILTPFTEGRGFRWEVHIDETPFNLWRIQGFPAPLPDSEAENKWRVEDKASAYNVET